MKLLVLTMENFQDIELVSFIGVLNASGKFETIHYWNPNKEKEVSGSNKIGIIKTIDKDVVVNDYDAIFIPGGRSCVDMRQNKKALELINEFIKLHKYIFAICDAPNVIAESNLLPDKKYVSYPIEEIKNQTLPLRQTNVKVYADQKYITGDSPNASIPLALLVIEKCFGIEERNKTYQKINGGN